MRKIWKRLKMVFTIRKFGPFLVEFFTTREVPAKKKFLSAGLIFAYFLFPFDIIPDFLAIFGLVDDIGILLFVLQQIIALAPESLRHKHRLDVN